MVDKRLVFFVMLGIFLFSITLGCAEPAKSDSPGPTPTPTPEPTEKPTETPNLQVNVTMFSPVDGGNVSVNEPVYGNSTGVYGSGLNLYLLISPLASNDNLWWVQPEAIVSPDGSWHVNSQFGRSAEQDIGAKFWVTAIVTSDELPVGQQASYPSDVKYSTKTILLTRS